MRRRRREIKQNARHHPTALLPLHVEARVGVTSCRLRADLPHALKCPRKRSETQHEGQTTKKHASNKRREHPLILAPTKLPGAEKRTF